VDYTHPLRRRVRGLGELTSAAIQPAVIRRGVVVGAHWWEAQPNFGDDLTRWLLPRYGIIPMHRPSADARLIAVGSILEALSPDYDGAIWGSGLILDREYPLPHAKVLALRGHLTRERVGADADVPLGDPGILVARRLRRPSARWDVGLVPHLDHRSHARFRSLAATPGVSVRVIDVRRSAPQAVREIAACRAIVSTSLHGLITADSYGIPATWTRLDPELGGGDFKFRDYESVITPGYSRFVPFTVHSSLPEILSHASAAPRATVAAVGDRLEAAIARLPEVLGELHRFPLGVMHVVGARPAAKP
jgi:hypothetical protein